MYEGIRVSERTVGGLRALRGEDQRAGGFRVEGSRMLGVGFGNSGLKVRYALGAKQGRM